MSKAKAKKTQGMLALPPGIPALRYVPTFAIIKALEDSKRTGSPLFAMSGGQSALDEAKASIPDGVEQGDTPALERAVAAYLDSHLPMAEEVRGVLTEGELRIVVLLSDEADGGPFRSACEGVVDLTDDDVAFALVDEGARAMQAAWYAAIVSRLDLRALFPRGCVWSRDDGIKGKSVRNGSRSRATYDGYAVVESGRFAKGDDAPSIDINRGEAARWAEDHGVDRGNGFGAAPGDIARHLRDEGKALVAVKDGKVAKVY